MSPTPTMRAVSLMARALGSGPVLTRLAAHVRARRHLHPRRPGAQPQVPLAGRPEERAGGLQRREREREDLARLRYPLRRGSGPVRRESLGVRAAVPRTDGEAEVRDAPRAVADHLHRAEGSEQQPALDGRYGDRGPRLPASSLRLDRSAALL